MLSDRETPSSSWRMPGLSIGYEQSFTHQPTDFLGGLKSGKPAAPIFGDAHDTNRLCDAIIASGKSEQWVSTSEPAIAPLARPAAGPDHAAFRTVSTSRRG